MWVRKRDVTIALELLATIAEQAGPMVEIDSLKKLLTDMDARTGRKDPSKRTRTR